MSDICRRPFLAVPGGDLHKVQTLLMLVAGGRRRRPNDVYMSCLFTWPGLERRRGDAGGTQGEGLCISD